MAVLESTLAVAGSAVAEQPLRLVANKFGGLDSAFASSPFPQSIKQEVFCRLSQPTIATRTQKLWQALRTLTLTLTDLLESATTMLTMSLGTADTGMTSPPRIVLTSTKMRRSSRSSTLSGARWRARRSTLCAKHGRSFSTRKV